MNFSRHLPTFNRVKATTLDLLFPIQCLGCNKPGLLFCETCLGKMTQFSAPVCPVCSRRLTGQPKDWRCAQKDHNRPLRFVLAPGPYENPLAHKAVALLKYQNVTSLAKLLAETIIKLMKQYDWSGFILIPVPLHPIKLRQRGFNQAELLAENIGPAMALPVIFALKKIENPKAQVGLKQAERMLNQFGAFEVAAPEAIQGKNILLVDDVCTTGATLTECARVLKKAGAKKVGAAVIAR